MIKNRKLPRPNPMEGLFNARGVEVVQVQRRPQAEGRLLDRYELYRGLTSERPILSFDEWLNR